MAADQSELISIEYGLPVRRLPQEMVEKIFTRVPFTSLMQSRAVCKRWDSFITSSRLLRTCQLPKSREAMPMLLPTVYTGLQSWSIQLFDSRTGRMLTIWLPVIDASLFPFYLTASCESLICFETKDHQSIIICNPVTMKWKHIQVPTPTAANNSCPLVDHKQVLTGLVVYQQLGTFKLVVASLVDRKTLIYDSRDESWKQGMHAPSGEEFVVCGALTFQGNIYGLVRDFHVQKALIWSYRLLKYSIQRDRWYEADMGLKLSRRKVDDHELELVEQLSEDDPIQPELILISRQHHIKQKPGEACSLNNIYTVGESSTGDEITLVPDFKGHFFMEGSLNTNENWKRCHKFPGSIVGIGNVLYYTASSQHVSSDVHVIIGNGDDDAGYSDCLYTWQRRDPETPMGMRLLRPSLMIDL